MKHCRIIIALALIVTAHTFGEGTNTSPAATTPSAPTNVEPTASDATATNTARDVEEVSTLPEKTRTHYENTLKYGTAAQKIQIIEEIERSFTHESVTMLIDYYPRERVSKVKVAMLNAFTFANDDRVTSVLSNAFDDADKGVRAAAYSLIGHYPTPEYEAELIKGLEQSDRFILHSCISTLGRIKSTNAVEHLIRLFDSGDHPRGSPIRSDIIQALGRIAAPEAETLISDVAYDPSESLYMRGIAIVALGGYPTQDNYDLLMEIFAENNPELTSRIIYILPAFKEFGDVVVDVFHAASSDAENVRLNALDAIEKMVESGAIESGPNREEAVRLLTYKVKYDPAIKVKARALEVIAKFPEARAVVEEVRDKSMNEGLKKLAKRLLKEEDAGEGE